MIHSQAAVRAATFRCKDRSDNALRHSVLRSASWRMSISRLMFVCWNAEEGELGCFWPCNIER